MQGPGPGGPGHRRDEAGPHPLLVEAEPDLQTERIGGAAGEALLRHGQGHTVPVSCRDERVRGRGVAADEPPHGDRGERRPVLDHARGGDLVAGTRLEREIGLGRHRRRQAALDDAPAAAGDERTRRRREQGDEAAAVHDAGPALEHGPGAEPAPPVRGEHGGTGEEVLDADHGRPGVRGAGPRWTAAGAGVDKRRGRAGALRSRVLHCARLMSPASLERTPGSAQRA